MIAGPMRYLLVALLAAGCLQDPSTDPGWSDPPIESGPGSVSEPGCHQDSDCGTNAVCARDGECLAPDDVRVAHITWTVGGAAADQTSCAQIPDLEIDFYSGETSYGYAPVPCIEGKFTVDKLPIWFTSVALSSQDETAAAAQGTIDAQTGDASLDLEP